MKKHIIFLAVFSLLLFSFAYAQESVEQYLINLTAPGMEDYIALIYESSHENQLLAATKLGEIGTGDEEVINALLYGLGQGTLFVRRQQGKVVNDHWDVRAASAKALGEIGDPRALPDLYIALRYDHDTFVKSSVAIAIGRIGQKESVSYLTWVIETSNPSGPDDLLVTTCVEALGNIGDKSGFPTLVEVLRGKYKRNIKIVAREAIKKIEW